MKNKTKIGIEEVGNILAERLIDRMKFRNREWDRLSDEMFLLIGADSPESIQKYTSLHDRRFAIESSIRKEVYEMDLLSIINTL